MSRKLILYVAVIGAFALLAVPVDAGGPPLVLNGINDRGPDLDAHAFELYGRFSSPEVVRPIVACDGKLVQAEIMAPPLLGQINVNVGAMRSPTPCTFH